MSKYLSAVEFRPYVQEGFRTAYGPVSDSATAHRTADSAAWRGICYRNGFSGFATFGVMRAPAGVLK